MNEEKLNKILELKAKRDEIDSELDKLLNPSPVQTCLSNKTLAEIITDLKFDYVNSNIIVENFPKQEVRGKYKVLHFDKYLKTKEIDKLIEKENCKPANLYELLEYAKNDWNKKDFVTALGSGWVDSDGDRLVPYLGVGGSERKLALLWDGPAVGWLAPCRFLVVSK